jgi:hypothetical protein
MSEFGLREMKQDGVGEDQVIGPLRRVGQDVEQARLKASAAQELDKAGDGVGAMNCVAPALDISGVAAKGGAEFEDRGGGRQAGEQRVDSVLHLAADDGRHAVDIGLQPRRIGLQGLVVRLRHRLGPVRERLA